VGDVDRRALVKGAAIGALSFRVGGSALLLTPREARAQAVPYRTLKPEEVQTIEALGDNMLPGAREAGIAHFIDQQVSGPAADCLLMARIANLKPPFVNFYRAAFAALDGATGAAYHQRFVQLSASDQRDVVDRMRQNKLENWKGPPQPFVYFIARHDAVDVVYGTVEGFEKLGIPYMAHINPTARW
jgi:hypothetical protein